MDLLETRDIEVDALETKGAAGANEGLEFGAKFGIGELRLRQLNAYRVDAGAADEGVARAADDEVVAATADEHVGARVTDQHVVAISGDDVLDGNAGVGIDGLALRDAGREIDRYALGVARIFEGIGAGAAVVGVVAFADPGDDAVVALAPEHDVVAANEDVGPRAAAQVVVAFATAEQVVARAARQGIRCPGRPEARRCRPRRPRCRRRRHRRSGPGPRCRRP